MRKFLFIFAVIGLMAVISGSVKAQDTETADDVITYQLDAIAILDIEGAATSLRLIKPAEAGLPVPDVTADTRWINYTSIVPSGKTNKVTVALDNAPPAFTTLKVAAAAHAGTGNGTYGTTAGEKTLTTSAQDIITGIGSCWTGDGNTNGHKLTYTWGITAGSYATAVAVASASDITATYTIVEAP